MGCSKMGGNGSMEVLRGEIINHKSRVWIGGWCQLKPVVEFICSQRTSLWLLLLLLVLMVPESGGPTAESLQERQSRKCCRVLVLGKLVVSVSTIAKCFTFTKHFFLSKDCKWAAWMGKELFSITRDKPNCCKGQCRLLFGSPIITFYMFHIYMCRCSCGKMGSLRQDTLILFSGCKQRKYHVCKHSICSIFLFCRVRLQWEIISMNQKVLSSGRIISVFVEEPGVGSRLVERFFHKRSVQQNLSLWEASVASLCLHANPAASERGGLLFSPATSPHRGFPTMISWVSNGNYHCLMAQQCLPWDEATVWLLIRTSLQGTCFRAYASVLQKHSADKHEPNSTLHSWR